jgi:hypothetical protein
VESVRGPTEQRVLLRNLSWETYERLIAEREERPAWVRSVRQWARDRATRPGPGDV